MVNDVIDQAKKVCFFAHYHHLGLAAGYTLHYLDELRGAGFMVVVVSTATMDDEQTSLLRDHCELLFFRENVGLDFGGWAECFRRFPALNADLLLLTNDSVYAPVTDLGEFIDRLTSQPADFYGAVECLDFVPHFQSWFILLRPRAYRSDAFATIMTKTIDPLAPKMQVVENFEVSLTASLRAAGLVGHAAYTPAGRLGRRWSFNPTHLLWRELIERYDIPFLKVELVRYNPVAIRTAARAVAVVRARNPVMADLIEDDRRDRPATTPSAGIAGWLRFFSAHHPPGTWIETQGFLVRDNEERTGWRDAANRAGFWMVVALGTGLRFPIRAIQAATRRMRALASRA